MCVGTSPGWVGVGVCVCGGVCIRICEIRFTQKFWYSIYLEKVYLRSQILERPSIDEYWNISGVPVLPENVIFTFFRTCRCYSETFNTGTQKWSSIVQYSCTSIWDLKYTFSIYLNVRWHHDHLEILQTVYLIQFANSSTCSCEVNNVRYMPCSFLCARKKQHSS